MESTLPNEALESAALPSDQDVEALAGVFRILADPTRIRIISLLMRDELCISDLASLLNLTESAISHQMRDLRLQRLVRARRNGRNVYYSLLDHHVRRVLEDSFQHVREP
jgi:ArsR family transcriptional regulator, lead/cadmium/zinc/bismuth-responsive transcriptional repressor